MGGVGEGAAGMPGGGFTSFLCSGSVGVMLVLMLRLVIICTEDVESSRMTKSEGRGSGY